LVGVVFGVLFAFGAPLSQLLNAMLGVWGESFITWYDIPQALAAFVVRKPGAYFITTGINMLSQAMAGNPAGFLPIILWWVVGGLAGELVLWWGFRWKKINFWKVAAAVGANVVFNWPVTAYLYGWNKQGLVANLAGTVIQVIMFGVESAGIAYLISEGLYRAGLLGGFKIARDKREQEAEA